MNAIGAYWITKLQPGSLIIHSNDLAVVVFATQTQATVLKYWKRKKKITYIELTGVSWETNRCELLIDSNGEL